MSGELSRFHVATSEFERAKKLAHLLWRSTTTDALGRERHVTASAIVRTAVGLGLSHYTAHPETLPVAHVRPGAHSRARAFAIPLELANALRAAVEAFWPKGWPEQRLVAGRRRVTMSRLGRECLSYGLDVLERFAASQTVEHT